MTTRLLPDTLKLICRHLGDNEDVQNLVEARVWTEAPANPSFPCVLVRRVGGIPQWWGDDKARIDIHCYGRTDEEARDLAREAFKALMEASQVHEEGVLTDVKPASDLQELADPTYRPPQPRYVFTVLATAHS